jgi:amino acid transporter
MENQSAHAPAGTPELIRGMNLKSAIALNMLDMIGVGPFITLPLIISAMGGPQAMLGWILGAVFALCDGLVWAELGASLPGAGGSYRYLSESYNPQKLGRWISFLFIWQLSFSAPLSIASGCIGLAQYASYIWPGLQTPLLVHQIHLGGLQAGIAVNGASFVAAGVCLFAVFLLYRRITFIGKLSQWMWVGVVLTLAWIIAAGVSHFNPHMAFSFPPGAFHFSEGFITGLGSAMLIATYDYWGYYNVCFLGGEVENPTRNIPKAVMGSIILVAIIYVIMNISVLGVLPWRDLMQTAGSNVHFYVISVFMQRLYGHWAGLAVTILIMWTAFASVFSLLLGYSRVPYAAAIDGNYFKSFGKLHPEHRFPTVSLLALGGVACLFCFLQLAEVIAALVVIRILLQFLVQAVGLLLLRKRRSDLPRPFRMALYPLPAVLAIIGFVYVLIARTHSIREIRYALVLVVIGTVLYLLRARQRREWPFPPASARM